MITTYPLEWLDSLILQTLNPEKTNISNLSAHDLALMTESLSKESQKTQIQLKKQLFSLKKKKQISLLVCKYHCTLVFLLDNVTEYQKNSVLQNGILQSIIDHIISTLNDLLSFIESRYCNYLSLRQRVPMSSVLVFRKEILIRLENIKTKKITSKRDGQIIEIVFTALSDSNLHKSQCKITYREILYYEELLGYLDAITDTQDHSGLFSEIDKLLIEMNFNYHPYISYFIDQIKNRIAIQENIIDKINVLLLFNKEFSQLLPNEKNAFDATLQSIKDVVGNWFKQEIFYLEKKQELVLKTNSGDLKPISETTVLNSKIECDLSGDQIALILRATDEARVIRARSMNYFFKMIVPHLSTPFKKDLSYHSVRSKSYTPEERDKEITIQTLERIIKKIKSY
jgi:hypothetical protein